MSSSFLLVAAWVASAPSVAAAPMRFGEPVVSAAGFEIPLEAPAPALKHAERHVRGDRVILFVPGVSMPSHTRSFGEGPVSVLKVTEAEHGVAITVQGRGPASRLADRLELVADGQPAIRVAALERAPLSSTAALPEPLPPTSPAARPTKMTAGFAEAAATPLSAMTTHKESAVPSVTILGVVILALGGMALWLKRHRIKDAAGTSIQVVATRAIGPKQRILLVEANGERFLLASSDKEVRVLSNLNHEGSFAKHLEETGEELDDHGDIGGLFRLRERSASKSEVAA